MIIDTKIENPAVVSNVAAISTFKIKTSAKAFSILSSGLYGNKILAIVRELSCNAYDSHIAAGKREVPFDLHLPTTLEPWFSIRDYGTGLTGEQVTSIYTTYFESTKTNSNDYIGALGLGSKSPFSYTDNFSITAIKDGQLGIFTAFINDEGVPSVACMLQEKTTDPNGVEIKFAVTDTQDNRKFRDAAEIALTYFASQPNILGVKDFNAITYKYTNRDIIPGVHLKTSRQSIAVMGNIAYPIILPSGSQKHNNMLYYGLEMHFNIGELDFQASREGLSYIPLTVNAIIRKLDLVDEALCVIIKTEIDKIPNEWAKARYLQDKSNNGFWNEAVITYANLNKLPAVDIQKSHNYQGIGLKNFVFSEKDLKDKYNLQLRALFAERISKSERDGSWCIINHEKTAFVVDDLKNGGLTRVRSHFKENIVYGRQMTYIMRPADAAKPALVEKFLAAMHNSDAVLTKTSDYKTRIVAKKVKHATILKLTAPANSWTNNRKHTWILHQDINLYDNTKKYYYAPLTGNTATSEFISDGSACMNAYSNIQQSNIFGNIEIYGVRRADIEIVKEMKNWVPIDDMIIKSLNKLNVIEFLEINIGTDFTYNEYMMNHITDKSSQYLKFIATLKSSNNRSSEQKSMYRSLLRIYNKDSKAYDLAAKELSIALEKVKNIYPMLVHVIRVAPSVMVDYINLVDSAISKSSNQP